MDGSRFKLLKNRLAISVLGVLAFMLLAPGLWSRLSSDSSQPPKEVAVVTDLAGGEAEAQEATPQATAEPTAEATTEPITQATAEPTAEPDSTPPTISSLAPADGTTINDATPEINAVLTEDGSGIDEATIVLTLDGATVAHTYNPTAKTVSYTPDTDLADGSYTLTLAVSDLAGNAATPASATFTVDTVAPTVTASPAGGLYNSPQVVSLTTSDPGTIYYTTDETDPTTSSSQYTDPITLSQPTVLKFIAVDAVGNQSSVSTEEYTIDTVPPVGTVSINKGAVFTRSTTVSVGVAATDDISGLSQVRIANSPEMIGSELANGTTYPYTGYKSWNLVDTANGTHTVYVQWSDKAGNWSPVVSDTIVIQTASEESKFLAIINQYRANKGLPTLRLSPKMNQAARWMSADMGAKRYFSHTDSLGRDPFKRVGAFGYSYNTYKAENLASGYELAQKVFDAWIKSTAHKKNMDNPNYRAIGIGRVYTKDSPYAWYWTTNFGGVMDTTTSAALSNHISVSGGYYQYNTAREVRVSGQVVGNFAGKSVSVRVEKHVYDKTKGSYVWKAYQTYGRTLNSDSRYYVSLSPGVGKYRVRASFAGGGDVKPSISPFQYFQVKEGQVSGIAYAPGPVGDQLQTGAMDTGGAPTNQPAASLAHPDRIIVRFKSSASPTTRASVRRQEKLERIRGLGLVRAEVVRVAGRSPEEAVSALNRRSDVEYAELDHVLRLSGYSDEEYISLLWGLHNSGQNNGSVDVDANALEASSVTLGDPNLVVAVIDDGVDFTHPDLKGRQWINPGESGGGRETNGTDDDGNGYVDDVNG